MAAFDTLDEVPSGHAEASDWASQASAGGAAAPRGRLRTPADYDRTETFLRAFAARRRRAHGVGLSPRSGAVREARTCSPPSLKRQTASSASSAASRNDLALVAAAAAYLARQPSAITTASPPARNALDRDSVTELVQDLVIDDDDGDYLQFSIDSDPRSPRSPASPFVC